ncbi:MAG: amidohydrolase family protein [Butyricicoccus sp.]
MIVDFHTHTFPEKIAGKTIAKLQEMACSKAFTQATNRSLQHSMERAGIDYSILLPVMTNDRQVEKLNSLAGEVNAQAQETGLVSFGGMHPDYGGDVRAELARVQELGLKGIKIHPAYQGYDLDDIRYMRIIDRAAELGLYVMTHAGFDIGIPGHDYCAPDHVVHVMREIGPDKLILAHLGGWRHWDEVEQKLAGLPLYMDTAFVLGTITPPDGKQRKPGDSWMLSDEAFLRIVRKHGADRILFATDNPWSDQKASLEHIRSLPLSEQEQTAILGENARRILGLPERK